jgi:indolepyruvate ferredoxin oxidoreductase alpha subunit
LHALKLVARRTKGIVVGDIGCHDAGSFPPLELQSTIYCMGASIAMGSGMAQSGFDKPVFALIGDSTFFHSGLPGLVNAVHSQAKLIAIVADNGTTAMTGFQPHPGSPENARGNPARVVSIAKIAEAFGASVQTVNPYDIDETMTALNRATREPGVSVIVASAPCYLYAKGRGETVFEVHKAVVMSDECNGCRVCIDYFGCPSIHFENGKAIIDALTCVGCGLCLDVCKRGAIA